MGIFLSGLVRSKVQTMLLGVRDLKSTVPGESRSTEGEAYLNLRSADKTWKDSIKAFKYDAQSKVGETPATKSDYDEPLRNAWKHWTEPAPLAGCNPFNPASVSKESGASVRKVCLKEFDKFLGKLVPSDDCHRCGGYVALFVNAEHDVASASGGSTLWIWWFGQIMPFLEVTWSQAFYKRHLQKEMCGLAEVCAWTHNMGHGCWSAT